VPAVGQIRVLQHMDLQRDADRLGLIVDVDERLAVANVLMLSPLVEYQTSVDYALDQASTGARMPLIAESDLRGAVWFAQLGPSLGHVSPEVAAALDAVGCGASPDETGLGQADFGLPSRDERDTRWGWKLAELDALNVLTSECDEWILDGGACPGIVDPDVFDSLSRSGGDITESTLLLLDLVSHHDAWVTEDSSEQLLQLLADASPDMQAAMGSLVERNLARGADAPEVPSDDVHWVNPALSRENSRWRMARDLALRAGQSNRCVVVLTSHESWKTTPTRGSHPVLRVGASNSIQVNPVYIDQSAEEVAA